MILQTRDITVTSAGEDLYTVLHNATASQLSTFLHTTMVEIIGNTIGIFLSTIALVLGFSSVFLLSSKRTLSRQDTLLRVYTVVLLLLVIAFQIQALFNTFLPLISLFHSFEKRIEENTRSAVFLDLTLTVGASLTDGLLVWRCFMVQRVLGNSLSKWGNIFWVFPTFLWLATVVLGVTATAGRSLAWFGIVSASGFATNVALNLYATIFICIHLLLHKRMITRYLGRSVPTTQHIYIVGILLESAAVNLPVTIGCSIGIGMGTSLETTLLPITVANQVLASVLIIHQAALGKVLRHTGRVNHRISTSLKTASHV